MSTRPDPTPPLLDPLAYPGSWADSALSIGCGPLRSVDRTLLVAVGANGTPAVLHAKLHAAGVPCDASIVPATLAGVAIGHSAHVNRHGYLPAAPYAASGVVTPVRVLSLDADQLAAVDVTEPNYVRVRLPADRYRLSTSGAFDLYVSRWGVLARGDDPLPLLPQAELHRVLAEWLGSTAIFDPDDSVASAARLAQPAVQATVRQALLARGLIRDHGLRLSG